jgi:hypothetical protein
MEYIDNFDAGTCLETSIWKTNKVGGKEKKMVLGDVRCGDAKRREQNKAYV